MATGGGPASSDSVRGILLEMSDVLRSKADSMSSVRKKHITESRRDQVDDLMERARKLSKQSRVKVKATNDDDVMVVLGTYSGCKAYVSTREDQRLVDHLEDHLKSLSAFTGARDVKPGPCASYLEVLLYQIVSKCLVRHSRRARSEVIMEIWNETVF